MRHLLIIFCFLLTVPMSSCIGENFASQAAHGPAYQLEDYSEPLLKGVQQKVFQAFVAGSISGNADEMKSLDTELEKLYEKSGQKLITYWRAYLKFYSSIYYLKMGDEKQSEKEIDQGVNWMKNMKDKNSEDYALLAMLQGFSLQFKGMKVMFMASKIKDNAKMAVELDPSNPRANYVYASNDFHTPVMYGGGKEAEEYLLKAIALPAQKIENEYLPSWGREEAYEMLIKLYIKAEKWEKAKEHFSAGTEEFPESYTINQLAPKLIGK